jgi:hypothetical protein
MLDISTESTPGAPYLELLQVKRWSPASDEQLEPCGLQTLPRDERPDRSLLRHLLSMVATPFTPPFVRCVVAAASARAVVAEHNYFDLDFRCEYSLAHAGRFGTVGPPHTCRLHFFGKRFPSNDIFSVSSSHSCSVITSGTSSFVRSEGARLVERYFHLRDPTFIRIRDLLGA